MRNSRRRQSLKDKLKCLIFIPIISQTYCDPKSFAWKNEFCAFNKIANEDEFGRDIKLKNGNVTSRIFPIKIHDLNPEDKALLENELGGVIRAIEFIFKSAGVNRPLRANEDHPHDNLNKTFYRDQINKLTNAIKEIIECIIHPQQGPFSKATATKISSPASAYSPKPTTIKEMVSDCVKCDCCCFDFLFHFSNKLSKHRLPWRPLENLSLCSPSKT